MTNRTTLELGIIGLACLSLAGCATESTDPFGADDGKSDGTTPTLAGVYAGPDGATLFVEKGDALVILPDGNQVSGLLARDGTLGGSFTIDVEEGTVCGTYRISLWESEGVLGDGSRVELTWLRPQGSVVQQCGFMLAGEGEYARDAEPAALAGIYDQISGDEGATMAIDEGLALLILPDGNEVSGPLEREGTLGGSYTIDVEEGTVCGTYRISLWESEGVLGDGSRVELTWLRPEGSVVQQCGFMLVGEGEYQRR